VKIFREITGALARQGTAILSKISDYKQVYSIRDDLGPVVEAYPILIRRARNIEKWSRFFKDLLDGQYIGSKGFSSFLELTIELSRTMQKPSTSKHYSLPPGAVDAFPVKELLNKKRSEPKG